MFNKLKNAKLIIITILLTMCLGIVGTLLTKREVQGTTYTDSTTGLTWYYTVNGSNAIDVYLYSGTPTGTLTIPSTINGYTVTGIRGSQISTSTYTTYRYNILGKNTSNTTITEVVIPDTVTSIGINTFANFDAVTTFNIPDSVTTIGAYGFYNCGALTTVNFGTGVQTIGNYAFQNSPKLAGTLTLPASITTIGNYAFYNSPLVTAIDLSNTKLTSIGTYAFYGTSATSVSFPTSTLLTIGDYSFANNTKLTSVVIPDTVTTIGGNAFYNCAAIKTLTLGSSVKTINNYAFGNCTSLTSIIIPSGVTTIGNYAFYNCIKVTNLVIPSSVTSIGNYAFYGLSSLTGTLVIPEGITAINSYTFANCTNITGLTIGSKITTINSNAFSGCSKLEGTITIPDNVLYLYDSIFQNCNKITTLSIGSGVKSISSNAIKYMNGLTTIDVSENNIYYSSADGVLYNKLKTALIMYPIAKVCNNYEVLSTVVTINTNAFYNCLGIKGTITLPSGLTTINAYAFYNCQNLTGELIIPETVSTIGNYAFYNCKGLTKLTLPSDALKSIGTSAFYNCSGLKGDLIIPDSVTTLSSSAFAFCAGFDGNLYVGSGVTTINSNVFQQSCNFYKATISSSVTNVDYYAFDGFSDLWINNAEENVTLNSYFGGNPTNTYVHWLNDTHRIDISTLSGVKLVNTENSQEIVSGDYACETSLNYQIEIEDGYNYDNLVLVTVVDGDYDNLQIESLDVSKTYDINRLIRDTKISIQNLSPKLDLTLRTFITQVNRIDVINTREPVTSLTNGEFVFNHTKYPVTVKTGDLITYTIRVYNEGMLSGSAEKINLYIPEGLEFVSDNRTNTTYKWSETLNGKISTTYLEDTSISGYTGNEILDYEDIQVVLKVTAENTSETDARYVTIAEIAKESSNDGDSTPGSVTSAVANDYKIEESYASTSSSYILGYEDDDDFEDIIIQGKIKVDYTIKINKIDADTDELLAGAKFNLVNEAGEIISTKETGSDGTIDFGMITTYGEGQDVYYIEEAECPEGYVLAENGDIKVVVTKTILDENAGTYSVSVVCDVLNYNSNITRYEFTPVSTKEQLAKIGSGEKFTIDGVEYEYNVDSNYKLVNDIDLSGSQWAPIPYDVKGIIDGNGYAIKNMTITSTEEMMISEIGLFRTFSGIIQNLELKDVNISIQNINEDAISICEQPCVGAFAGWMTEGTISNCKVSGTISAATDNIGGFVGHTAEEHMVKFQNCTNNATVSGITVTTETATIKSSNVGGIVGCALGALSVTDCINNGAISTTNYNVGGIVGYVASTNYEEVSITADFDEEDKVITLLVENKRTIGEYEIEIENLDASTLGLIDGAVYTVLDKNHLVVEGCEEVQLTNGKFKVATVDINSLGIDTYYIEEVSPAPGYDGLEGSIKLVIQRYWDGEAGEYKVSVDTEVLTNTETVTDIPQKIDNTNPSQTGAIYSRVNFENVSWNVNKAKVSNCVNNGIINSTYMNAGGIVGNAHCVIEISDCTNTADISAVNYGKAAGIISEVNAMELNQFVKIDNCNNSGSILSNGSTGSAGGIVAHAIADIEITQCTNTGVVTVGQYSAASGILADLSGTLVMDSCTNEGEIIATSMSSYDVNCVAGGMLAKNNILSSYFNTNKSDNNVYISNCINTGNILSQCHTGAIIGLTCAANVEVKNCEVSDCYVHDLCGDKGGIIGFASSERVTIQSCIVDTVDISRASSISNTYGATGGIIGNLCQYSGNGNTSISLLSISDCNVIDSNIQTVGKEAAGILGMAYPTEGVTEINITDSTVDRCTILNENASGCYSSSGGIIGATYASGTILVDSCLVNDTSVETNGTSAYDTNVGGVCGINWNCDKTIIRSTNVSSCSITNNGNSSDSCANVGGILAGYGNRYSSTEVATIEKCNVIDTDMSTVSGNIGGIIGLGYYNGLNKVYKISDCLVDGGSIISTSLTSSNTCTGGIAGILQYDCNIQNCDVKNLDIIGKGRNVAGIIGCEYEAGTINNCDVYNVNVTSNSPAQSYSTNDCVAGIAGVIYNEANITNCTVDQCNILGDSCANVSGMVGCVSAAGNFKNLNLTNTDVTSKVEYNVSTSNSTTSGIIGSINDNLLIDTCKVMNCDFAGKGSIESGMIGYAASAIVKNSIVSGITITDTPGTITSTNAYRSIGGMAGSITSTGDFFNNDVSDVHITGESGSTGGIIGYVSQLDKFEDCNVTGLTIDTGSTLNATHGSAAGLIGDILTLSNGITNCKVSDINITSKSDNVAGIVGAICSTASISNCTVDNATLKNTNTYSSGMGNVGGIASYISNSAIFTNVNVKNSNLQISSGENTLIHLGGLLGFANGVTITDSGLTSTIIKNNAYGATAGLVGMTNYNVTSNIQTDMVISNANVKNCTEISGNVGVGGLLGFGKLSVTTGTVDNSTIKGNNSSAEVGGAVGNALASSNITQIDVKNSIIKSLGRAGGILGFGPTNTSYCDVIDTSITTTGSMSEAGGIVAVASNASSEITYCTVTNSNVTGVNGNIGGIAGFANNTIEHCNVKNSNITSTGTSAYGLGGIVGQGSNYNSTKTYIANCIVEECKLAGFNAVGGIAGAAVANIDTCNVIGILGTIIVPATIEGEEDETVTTYSSTIEGQNYVGGILGDAGQLISDVNTYSTLTDCIIRATQITGLTNVTESIGRNSYYNLEDTTIYDVITNLIKENCNIIISNE